MGEQLHTLKYVTDTLSSARQDQLPQIIPSLTHHLSRCSDILSGRIDAGPPGAAQIHKLRTQISSLLQEKDVQGRWASVVLIKTVVEAAIKSQEGWEFLQTTGSYVRGLLAILGKPDPIPTRTMSMIVLTRLFLLTKGRPTLTREITTPHLSSFITACLGSVNGKAQGSRFTDPSSPFLETVLQCFIRLLPSHPAVFRPFNGQIRALLSPLIAPTPSDLRIRDVTGTKPCSRRLTRLAHRLHGLLPSYAPKNGGTEEWKKSVNVILNHINRTADVAFRAIIESRANGLNDHKEVPQDAIDEIEDDLLLTGWRGVSAGCERIIGLLSLLSAYLSAEGNSPYQVPISSLYQIADRMLSIARPQNANHNMDMHVNRQISREERETLYMFMPMIHAAALQLLSTIITRTSILAFGFAGDLLEQIAWMVQRSNPTAELRTAMYQTVRYILELIGPSLQMEQSASIKGILQMACRDLVPHDQRLNSQSLEGQKKAPQALQYHADSFVSNNKNLDMKQKKPKELQFQASQLLNVAMVRIPASTVTHVRQEIDQVAVLLQDQELQLASILNPHSKQSSMNLLPFLVNGTIQSIQTEALLQRRIGTIVQPRAEKDDSMSSASEDAAPKPQFVQAMNFDFQATSATSFQQPEASNLVEMVAIPKKTFDLELQPTERVEPMSKRPRLDMELAEVVRQPSNHAIQSQVMEPTNTVVSPKHSEVGMEDAAQSRSDSDDSFEVPEIVVGLDDSDEDTDDE